MEGWSIVANIVIFIGNIVVAVITYKINKRSDSCANLLSDLLRYCDNIDTLANKYWCMDLKQNERKECAFQLKNNLKRSRDTLTLLCKKHLKRDANTTDYQNSLNDIDRKATGSTFETVAFVKTPSISDEVSDLVSKFRTQILEKKAA